MWNESMIKSFLVVAGASSFSEAAKRSYFTQQAISKQIARLEHELDTQLFQRMHGGVRLTQTGEIYYAAFKQVIEMIEQAECEANRLQKVRESRIRLGYIEMLSIDPIWNDFVALFREQHPEVEMTIETYTDLGIHTALLEEKVDAAIMFGGTGSWMDGLEYITIGNEFQMMLCVNKDYPGAAEAVTYRELDDIMIFMPDRDENWIKERLAPLDFEKVRYERRSSISSALLSVNMLEGGILVGNHCEFQNNPKLRFFEVPGSEKNKILLAWKKDNHMRALHQMIERFRDYSARRAEVEQSQNRQQDNTPEHAG